MQNETKIKISLLLILFLISIFLCIIIFLFTNYLNDDKDICLDTGICKEGLIINTENGQITVNENTCAENKGKWINKDKACMFK